MTRQLLVAVCFLHSRGSYHGDLKPGNVLVGSNGSLKLVDYGPVFKGIKTKLFKHEISYLFGTVPYMAPECFTQKEVDHAKADIWSIGCLLIHLASGLQPWSELEHDWAIMYRLGATKYLPEALLNLPISASGIALIKACLNHDPDLRPAAEKLLVMPYLTTNY